MSDPKANPAREIPVVCSVCRTRSYANATDVGREIVCPDCGTHNRVPPAAAPAQPFQPRYTGDEYALREVDDPATRAAAAGFVKFNCGTCSTLLDAPLNQVGKQVACPDCGTWCVVPPPPPAPPPFQAADASDVTLDEPPPEKNVVRQRVADRLLHDAAEHLRAQAAAQPKRLLNATWLGILAFPFQVQVLPVWIGLAVGLLAIAALVDTVISMTRSLSLEYIMAVFVALIAAFATALIAGLCIPPLMTIIEFTADGLERIPHWPGHDLLDRGRVLLYAVNSFAMSALPGMLPMMVLSGLGVPSWLGLLTVPLLWPVVLLSMLEADSPFVPFSNAIRTSFRQVPHGWKSFYLRSLGLAAALAIPAVLLFLYGHRFGRVYLMFAVSYYAVVYCRLLGRLAWLVGQAESEAVDERTVEPDADSAGPDDRSAV